MAGRNIIFKVNTREFDSTLRRYRGLSRRTPANVCNKKAYYILRRAIWYTHKTDIAKLREEMGETKAMELRQLKSGRWSKNKKLIRSFFTVPKLALIIQARFGPTKKRRSPWYGVSRAEGATKMLQEMRKVWAARLRSVAFIKSGWIEARDTYKKLAGVARGLPPEEGKSEGGPKRIGQPKGGAIVAVDGWRSKAIFWNTAAGRDKVGRALFVYGQPALQRAFDEEAKSMAEECERRERENAQRCGIRTN